MIIRISQEGQFRVSDDAMPELDKLDDAITAALDRHDEPAYRETFAALLSFVRANGDLIDDEDLVASDLILPPADQSFDEASVELDGDGLIPEVKL